MRLQLSFIILVLMAFLNVQMVEGQETSDEYWTALGIAMKYYDEADYVNASQAFDTLWTKLNKEELANHRLYAAASNCMIDNEDKVRENLFKIVSVANKTDMKRVLINYEIFNKYKSESWWAELELKLDQRLKDLIAHHKNLRIFKKGRNFRYSAFRINKEGDTLANTYITMIPDGTGWGDKAASSQSQVKFKYDYTIQDSLDHIAELDSISHRKFWEGIDTTGIIETDELFWIHPIRNNEFFKTEIAPFPVVKFPISKEIMEMHKPKTVIMNNWGTYSHTQTRESYSYLGEVNKNYLFEKNLTCHRFHGIGTNTKHGKSELDYFFNEEYGFVEMNYTSYDGDSIQFKLIEVIYLQ